MDYLSLFTTAFLVGLSGAMMSGAMLTVTISETTRRGFWVSSQVVLGHVVVELLLVACLAGGHTYSAANGDWGNWSCRRSSSSLVWMGNIYECQK